MLRTVHVAFVLGKVELGQIQLFPVSTITPLLHSYSCNVREMDNVAAVPETWSHSIVKINNNNRVI